MKEQFYTGSYATADNDSIYEYELDTDTGSLKKITSIKGVDNPSYLLVCPEKNIIFFPCHPEGQIHAICPQMKTETICLYQIIQAEVCQFIVWMKRESR